MEKLISWFEIPANDFDRAVKFYQTILKKELTIFDCENEKMACFPNDGINTSGAISFAPDFKPSPNGVLVSFYAGDDLNLVVDRIQSAGGTINIPKTKIEVEGMGYFAVFTDSEGNKLGLYSDN